MEKQSNSDTEQTKSERTSTSTDGQSPSPETSTPSGEAVKKYLVYSEPELKTYFIDIGGELSLHNEIKGVINREKVGRLQFLLDNLTLCLMDRGMKHVDTWVEDTDEKGIKFAEIFGFRETGFLKKVDIGDRHFSFTEMRLEFPDMEEKGQTE